VTHCFDYCEGLDYDTTSGVLDCRFVFDDLVCLSLGSKKYCCHDYMMVLVASCYS
jgi:hypothetical protein